MLTWKEFKKIVESQGVNEETVITYIDTDMFKPTVTKTNSGAYIE